MNEDEKQRLTQAFAHVQIASENLDAAVKLLVKFGEKNVPDIGSYAFEMFAERIKSISFSTGFLQSFLRISLLQQVVKPKVI